MPYFPNAVDLNRAGRVQRRPHIYMTAAPSEQLTGFRYTVTEQDFLGYVKYRTMDSIGNPGAYRRFMQLKREQRAPWAVTMWAQINAVNAALRDLTLREQELKQSHSLHVLSPVWQYIVDSNMPPTDLPLVIAACALSGKENVPCIVIRGKGRGSQPYTVSNRFSPFFFRLWLISKIDILLKVYTRTRMAEHDPQNQLSLAEAATHMQAREPELGALARAFFKAYVHVLCSICHGLTDIV